MTLRTRLPVARLRVSGLVAVGSLATALLAGAAGMSDESRVVANLLKLHGEIVPMLYSPGALDRAAHVQQRLDALKTDVRKWSGIDLDLRAVVLSPEDWQSLRVPVPYGLPQWTSIGLASPAWGDQHSVALWHELVGADLPWGGGDPLRGSRDEAASLALSDTLLQVECGRLAAARAIAVRGPDWIAELLAHVVALAAVAMHEEEREGEIAALYAALAQRLPAPGPVRAFAVGAEYRVRLAYQPLFERGARIVLAKDGRKSAKTLLRLPEKNGGQLTEGDLVARYPELKAWLASDSVAPPPTAH